jgi:myo-inositol-1(or 4)-monophosphatase
MDAAREAGRMLVVARRHGPHPEILRVKGLNDFVTEMDERAEDIIVARLREAFPGDVVVAEERGELAGAQGGGRWLVDPLDGTTNFLHGVPIYAVSIACEVGGALHCGVVYDPNRDEMFVAQQGCGAYLNGRRISVSGVARTADCLLTTGFPYRDFRYLESYFRLFTHILPEVHGLRRPGAAALDLCWTACGRFDGFCELGLKPWDVAAGSLIVREAGGKVTDWYGTDDFLDTGNIVATNGHIHAWLLGKMAAHFLDREVL